MGKFKVGLMAAMVSAALAAPMVSHAAGTILFDQTGTGSSGQVISQFSWLAGNALMQNMADGSSSPPIVLGIPGVFTTSYTGGHFLGQAILGGLGGGSLNPAFIFSYQFDVPVSGSNVLLNLTAGQAGQSNSMSANSSFATPGTFKICADAVTPNQVAGTGYCQTTILSGSAFIDPNVGFNLGQTAPDSSTTALGTIGGANATTPTVHLTGAASLIVDVDPASVNLNYFLSDISSLVLTLALASTDADISQQVGFTAPFDPNNDVNAAVVGATPNYGADGRNNFYCDPATANGTGPSCDVQVQSSGTTFFNHSVVPEPGSMALLGLGLGIIGFGLRKRARVA